MNFAAVTIAAGLLAQRDKRVVLLHVSFQDVHARSEQPLESRPVQLHALQVALRDYGGRSGAIQDQRHFTEVFALVQFAYLFAHVILRFLLVHDRLAVLDDVEIVASFALLNDHLSVGELTRHQRIGDRRSFPIV